MTAHGPGLHDYPFIGESPQPPQHPNGKDTSGEQIALVAGIATFVLGVVGAVLATFTSVSLMSGTGTVWIGAALTIGTALIAWVVPRVRTWIKVACVVLAVIGVASALYDEHQLNEKRQQIEQILTP